jgi:transposase
MDLTPMGKRNARRLGVVQAAEKGKYTSREGAEELGLSVRQFKRLRARVRQQGPQGLVHGNRGRVSKRRLRVELRERVAAMLRGSVKLNDHHIADLLREEGWSISPASVRRMRSALRLPPKRRRRPPRHRRRRDRRARRGELVLIDGSPLRWFDDQAPAISLLGAIDDASGEILALTFRPTEDLHGYTVLLHNVITGHGVPEAFYGDRCGVLIRNDPHWTLEEELAGRQTPPQFGRMLEALGVRFIAATSPQAKGRVERLWGTLQDRLAAELRLHGHTTLAAAQAYLPRFIARHNLRRGQPPADTVSAFRAAPRDLDRILACRYERVVARDNTVTVAGRWAQVPPGPRGRSWHPARVEVRELLDGRLLVFHPNHGLIAEQPAPAGCFILESRSAPRAKKRRAQNHSSGSLQQPERQAIRVQPQPRHPGIGRLTHIRRPAPDHPYRRGKKPQPPTPVVGVEGVTKSLTR